MIPVKVDPATYMIVVLSMVYDTLQQCKTHVITIKPKLPNYTHDYITTMCMVAYFLHLSPLMSVCV